MQLAHNGWQLSAFLLCSKEAYLSVAKETGGVSPYGRDVGPGRILDLEL
jgi:hypothetical protein